MKRSNHDGRKGNAESIFPECLSMEREKRLKITLLELKSSRISGNWEGHPQGTIVQYTYAPVSSINVKKLNLQKKRLGTVWRNVPPANSLAISEGLRSF